jgi:hypothetical protein
METNIDKSSMPEGGFWHSGWAYFIFLIGIIVVMIAISYTINWLF